MDHRSAHRGVRRHASLARGGSRSHPAMSAVIEPHRDSGARCLRCSRLVAWRGAEPREVNAHGSPREAVPVGDVGKGRGELRAGDDDVDCGHRLTYRSIVAAAREDRLQNPQSKRPRRGPAPCWPARRSGGSDFPQSLCSSGIRAMVARRSDLQCPCGSAISRVSPFRDALPGTAEPCGLCRPEQRARLDSNQ